MKINKIIVLLGETVTLFVEREGVIITGTLRINARGIFVVVGKSARAWQPASTRKVEGHTITI